MKKISCYYCIVIGVCMLVMWSLLLASGQVTELKSEPYRITAHIISEVITALLLIIGGLSFLKNKPWGKIIHLVSLGSLFYSVLTAGGYYLQKGDVAMTIMFACFTVATVFFVITFVQGLQKKP